MEKNNATNDKDWCPFCEMEKEKMEMKGDPQVLGINPVTLVKLEETHNREHKGKK